MKDPLILEARLERDSWGDWKSANAVLCEEGIEGWFALPRKTRPVALWVVVSPYRSEGYALVNRPWGGLWVEDPENPNASASFVSSTQLWLRRWLRSHPKYNFYIHIEAEHVKQGKRIRSWLRPTRLLHAAGT